MGRETTNTQVTGSDARLSSTSAESMRPWNLYKGGVECNCPHLAFGRTDGHWVFRLTSSECCIFAVNSLHTIGLPKTQQTEKKIVVSPFKTPCTTITMLLYMYQNCSACPDPSHRLNIRRELVIFDASLDLDTDVSYHRNVREMTQGEKKKLTSSKLIWRKRLASRPTHTMSILKSPPCAKSLPC